MCKAKKPLYGAYPSFVSRFFFFFFTCYIKFFFNLWSDNDVNLLIQKILCTRNDVFFAKKKSESKVFFYFFLMAWKWLKIVVWVENFWKFKKFFRRKEWKYLDKYLKCRKNVWIFFFMKKLLQLNFNFALKIFLAIFKYHGENL